MEPTSTNISRHVTIENMHDENGSLLCCIKEKMMNLSLLHYICRVPEKLSKFNEENYFPKLVSIGPLHHDKEILHGTEDRKWQYLNTLLNRKTNVDANLESCVKAPRNLEERARKCYGEKLHMTSDEFVKMMLVGGCFIIELFLKMSIKGLRRRNDPFFETSEVFFRLRCDLILLENQIPFFVLQQLFNIVPIPKQCTLPLVELALRFFRKMIHVNYQSQEERLYDLEIKHLLDLIHQCYLPTYPEDYSNVVEIKYIDHASKLHKLGIKFKKARSKESLLDVKFVKDGVLEFPPLALHNYSAILLRNLIALEQCYDPDSIKHVTSYVLLMKSLIQSQDDVKFLCKMRILKKNNGNKEKEFLALFKKMEVEIEANALYYRAIFAKINGYHGQRISPFGAISSSRFIAKPLGIFRAVKSCYN